VSGREFFFLIFFRIPSLIQHCSHFTTLYPGDMILTGTPGCLYPLNVNQIKPGQVANAGLEAGDLKVEMKFPVELKEKPVKPDDD